MKNNKSTRQGIFQMRYVMFFLLALVAISIVAAMTRRRDQATAAQVATSAAIEVAEESPRDLNREYAVTKSEADKLTQSYQAEAKRRQPNQQRLAQFKQKLTDKVHHLFSIRQAMQKEDLQKYRQRLHEIEDRIARREVLKHAIVDRRVLELIAVGDSTQPDAANVRRSRFPAGMPADTPINTSPGAPAGLPAKQAANGSPNHLPLGGPAGMPAAGDSAARPREQNPNTRPSYQASPGPGVLPGQSDANRFPQSYDPNSSPNRRSPSTKPSTTYLQPRDTVGYSNNAYPGYGKKQPFTAPVPKITAVDGDYVEIWGGSNMYFETGVNLFVYRGASTQSPPVGSVMIIQADRETSVARAITKNAEFKVGDHVHLTLQHKFEAAIPKIVGIDGPYVQILGSIDHDTEQQFEVGRNLFVYREKSIDAEPVAIVTLMKVGPTNCVAKVASSAEWLKIGDRVYSTAQHEQGKTLRAFFDRELNQLRAKRENVLIRIATLELPLAQLELEAEKDALQKPGRAKQADEEIAKQLQHRKDQIKKIRLEIKDIRNEELDSIENQIHIIEQRIKGLDDAGEYRRRMQAENEKRIEEKQIGKVKKEARDLADALRKQPDPNAKQGDRSRGKITVGQPDPSEVAPRDPNLDQPSSDEPLFDVPRTAKPKLDEPNSERPDAVQPETGEGNSARSDVDLGDAAPPATGETGAEADRP